MGLKSDIYDAFVKNLGDAIIDFIVKQDFNITEMEAPYNILPGKVAVATAGSPAAQSGANTAPVIGVVQISETSNKVGLPTVNTNVRKSKVKLISVKEA